MDYQHTIETMSREVYQRLKLAVELGKWPDGRRLTARQRDFSEAYRAFVDSVDLGELQIEPDAVFEALRDDSAGRDVAL